MIPGVAAVYATGLLSSSSLIPQDLLHYFHVSLTKSFFVIFLPQAHCESHEVLKTIFL